MSIASRRRFSIADVDSLHQENQLKETLELVTKIEGPQITLERMSEIKYEIRRCEDRLMQSERHRSKMYLSVSTILIATLIVLAHQLLTSDPSIALKVITTIGVVYILALLYRIFKLLKVKRESVNFTKEVLEQYVNAKLILLTKKYYHDV